MQLDFELTDDGVVVALDGGRARIRWPEEVWRQFAGKRELATELVFLVTAGAVRGEPVRYGFPRPRFLELYERWLASTAPYLAETLGVDREALTREYAHVERCFTGTTAEVAPFPATDPNRAVAALTMGKDSLASLVVARALGLEVAAVNCQHPTVSDDHLLRGPAMAAVGAELGVSVHSVIDEVKGLAQAAAPPGHPSGIHWSLAIAAYVLVLVPFAAAQRARYLLVGNEQELSHPLRAASGERFVASPLQSIDGMGELDRWISALTSGGLRLTSLVHALHRMAGHRLIHRVRPAVGAHQISCRQARAVRRWCGACRTCAENGLFIAASGRAPSSIDLPLMFDAEHREHYVVADHDPDPADPYRFRLAEQELLAFATLASAGEDTSVQRLLRQRLGSRLEQARERLERTYLSPVEPASALPLAGEALVCARRLLAG